MGGVTLQSRDHQSTGQPTPPEEASVVGDRPVHLEPTSELSLSSFLSPVDTSGGTFSDPVHRSTITDFVAPDSSLCPAEFCGSDFADIPDAELEKFLSPFARDDSGSESEYWDLESFIAA